MMMSVFKPSTLTLKVRHDGGVATVEHGRQFFWNRRHDTTPRHSSPVGASSVGDVSGGRDAGGGSVLTRARQWLTVPWLVCGVSFLPPPPLVLGAVHSGREARYALHGHVPKAPLPHGGFCGMLWDIFPCLHLIFLCRGWWLSCRTLCSSIEVPKILPFDVPLRANLRVTQLVEQLVEVPTIISFSSFQRTVEQHVDIPVSGGGGASSGLQGISSGQSSTASPSTKKHISERIVERIVDPVSSGGLPHSLPGQSSSSSHSPAGVLEDVDEPGEGFFRTFPQNKKGAKLAPHSSPTVPTSVSSSTPAAQLVVQLRDSNANCSVWKAPAGVEVVWCGTRDDKGSFTTNTKMLVPVCATSLLFLLGDGRHRQPRAVHKYWAPCRLCSVEIFFTWKRSPWYSSLRLYGCTRTSVRSGLRSIPSPSLLW